MQHADVLALAGLRVDGRKYDDIRQILCKINISSTCDGSCYYEQGLNKVLVYIHGPMEPSNKRNDANNDEGFVSCRFVNAPFSGVERKQKKGDRRSLETETTIVDIFSSAIKLDLYSKSEIAIVIHLLESDGSSLCAIINATTMALLHSGISMQDIVVSCSTGLIRQEVCLDLSQLEQSSGYPYIPLAIYYRSEEMIFIQLDSKLSIENVDECLKQGVSGCKRIGNILENLIKENMLASLLVLDKSIL